MDAKYLHIEKCYVKLYAAILNEGAAPFDLNYTPYISKVPSVRSVATSWSVASFYVTLMLIVSVLAVYLAAFADAVTPKP